MTFLCSEACCQAESDEKRSNAQEPAPECSSKERCHISGFNAARTMSNDILNLVLSCQGLPICIAGVVIGYYHSDRVTAGHSAALARARSPLANRSTALTAIAAHRLAALAAANLARGILPEIVLPPASVQLRDCRQFMFGGLGCGGEGRVSSSLVFGRRSACGVRTSVLSKR